MFPAMKVKLRGLEPTAHYILLVDVVPVDSFRYKYQGGRWTIGGNGDPAQFKRMYIHPLSPSTGQQWMEKPVSFQKLKVTNNQTDRVGYVRIET